MVARSRQDGSWAMFPERSLVAVCLCCAECLVGSAAAPIEASFSGKRLAIEDARISAMPFNRVWPGYQRSIDQTRMSAFVGFDVPLGGGVLSVGFGGGEIPASARIRPFSRRQPVREGNAWCVRIEHPEQFVIEFEGGRELHVFADPPLPAVVGGKIRRFGPGEHHPGAIFPTDGETIVIERGAKVYGNLVLTDVRNVSVVGRGILDSSEQKRVDPDYAGVRHLKAIGCSDALAEWGTAGVFALRCRNVKIDGVTFRDAPRWTMNFQSCDGVDIRGVKLIGMWRYNSDGIDICGCRNVRLEDLFIRSFDDCVIARPPCRDMRVTNCVLWCDWGLNIKVQHSEKAGVMENITFDDIKSVAVDSAMAGIMTRYGSTNSVIRNVRLKDIEVDAPPDRPKNRYQVSDEQRYVYAPSSELLLLLVNAYALGRPTPNQGAPIPVDEDTLRFEYDGIIMEDVSVYSAPGVTVDEKAPFRVLCRIDAVASGFNVRNVALSGLPSCAEVVQKCRKGNISGVTVKRGKR